MVNVKYKLESLAATVSVVFILGCAGWIFSHRQQNVGAQHLEELRNSVTPIVDSDEDSDEDYQNPMIPIPAGYSEGYERSRREIEQRLHEEAERQLLHEVAERQRLHEEAERQLLHEEEERQRQEEERERRRSEWVAVVKNRQQAIEDAALETFNVINKDTILSPSGNTFIFHDHHWINTTTRDNYVLKFVNDSNEVRCDRCSIEQVFTKPNKVSIKYYLNMKVILSYNKIENKYHFNKSAEYLRPLMVKEVNGGQKTKTKTKSSRPRSNKSRQSIY